MSSTIDITSDYIEQHIKKYDSKHFNQAFLRIIHRYKFWTLENVSVEKIDLESLWLNHGNIQLYKRFDPSTMPPIVMAEGKLIDGFHRSAAAKELNLQTIKAYVPLKHIKENFINENIPRILYHGTYKPLLKNINELGLGEFVKDTIEDNSMVHLYDNFKLAKEYAKNKKNISVDFLDQIIVLTIDIKNLNPLKTFQDPENPNLIKYQGVIKDFVLNQNIISSIRDYSPERKMVQCIVTNFLDDKRTNNYQNFDSKSITRVFVNWANENNIRTEVICLSPPSEEIFQNRPELKNRKGFDQPHVIPMICGYAIDFTAHQFPNITNNFWNPLITSYSRLQNIYFEIGGYFTDSPTWFGGRTHYHGNWGRVSRKILPADFKDDFL